VRGLEVGPATGEVSAADNPALIADEFGGAAEGHGIRPHSEVT
jgi:hypothetical protein